MYRRGDRYCFPLNWYMLINLKRWGFFYRFLTHFAHFFFEQNFLRKSFYMSNLQRWDKDLICFFPTKFPQRMFPFLSIELQRSQEIDATPHQLEFLNLWKEERRVLISLFFSLEDEQGFKIDFLWNAIFFFSNLCFPNENAWSQKFFVKKFFFTWKSFFFKSFEMLEKMEFLFANFLSKIS